MLQEILKRILDRLHGLDGCLFAAGVIGWFAIWGWLSTPKNQRTRVKRKMAKALIPAIVATIGIAVHHVIPPKPFPTDVAGILVLRLAGDNVADSLQTDLVDSLDTELAKDTNGERIVVRAADDCVYEKQGLADAHKEARRIGEQRKAQLVIWGSRVDQTKFHPRITIVRETNDVSFTGERTLMVQDIHELSLPPETVALPIYLAHFLAGYSCYSRSQPGEALNHFEAAVRSPQSTPEETADLQFLMGNCHLEVAQRQKAMTEDLQAGINDFILATNYYGKTHNLEKLAQAQNNLGLSYANLPTGDHTENLNKAIAAYNAALQVFTEKDFRDEWASTQINLGNAYDSLPTGDYADNFKRALAAFQAAQRVLTERGSPFGWANLQVNLGSAYAELATGNRTENLMRAIDAFRAALRILSKKDMPLAWALTQINLGSAYAGLPNAKPGENFKKALEAYQAALQVFTEKDYPLCWAVTQLNLSSFYVELPTRDRAGNIEKALTADQAALRVFSEKDFPPAWADAQLKMGSAYSSLPIGDRKENLKKAVAAELTQIKRHRGSKTGWRQKGSLTHG